MACDIQTKLMLHCNGADGSPSFPDASQSAHVITAVGNVQVDDAQGKFNESGLFDGTGDWLTALDHSDWFFGDARFTLDLWARYSATTSQQGLIEQSTAGSNGWKFFKTTTGELTFHQPGGTSILTSSGAGLNVIDTWFHLAVIRGWGGNVDDWALTVNGVAKATATNSVTMPDHALTLFIGALHDGGIEYEHIGWMDEIRISKGIARWTSNFTPPTIEYCAAVRNRLMIIS